jgi:hypothetical protein
MGCTVLRCKLLHRACVWRTISLDVHMIDNILRIIQSGILQKYGHCLICAHCAWYLLEEVFAIKRITKLDVFYIH